MSRFTHQSLNIRALNIRALSIRARIKVAPEGLEPPTFSLGVRRSIHLNYGAKNNMSSISHGAQ
jgi:hypothetical protein